MNKIGIVGTFMLLLTCQKSFCQSIPYDSLVHELSIIFEDDQKYRVQQRLLLDKKDYDSLELKSLGQIIREKDSVNLLKVKWIINKYGWLGPDKIGIDGNHALSMVIQHAALAEQLYYLEVLRTAVKIGNARPATLAHLEDGILVAQGKLQIYGTQVGLNLDTGEYFVFPLEDPDGVEKRRSDSGLPTFTDYLRKYKINWDANQYKEDLPRIQALLRGKYPGF